MFHTNKIGIAAFGGVTASLMLAAAPALALRLEAGTVVPVTLDRQLTSNGNAKGDTFTATIKSDTPGYLGLPEGSVIEGVVMEAKPKEGKNPGVLDLAFRRVRLPNGRAYALTGSTIGLDNKSVTKDSNGKIVAKSSSRNNRLTYVGYGAGAGLLASVLSGGKLHLENIGLGAGLGYLLGSLEKSKKTPNDVNLKVGTQMGVRLDKPLTLQTADSSLNSRSTGNTASSGGNGGYRNTESGGSALDRPRDANNGSNGSNGSNAGRSVGNNNNGNNTSSDSGIGVLINDTAVNFPANTQPQIVNGVTMVPVRPVLDAANVKYTFSNNNGTINVQTPNGTTRLSVGSQIAVGEGGGRTRLDASARRMNGTMYVPLRFLDLALGGKTTYDAASKTAIVSTK